MIQSRHNVYIYEWVEKIQSNIQKLKLHEFTDTEKIDFISQQYHLLMLIHRALNGQVLFVGAKTIGDQLQK